MSETGSHRYTEMYLLPRELSDVALSQSRKTGEKKSFFQDLLLTGCFGKPGWVAVVKSPTAMLWGSEIYNKTNRFGRYQSHGTLEILYDGGLVPISAPKPNSFPSENLVEAFT